MQAWRIVSALWLTAAAGVAAVACSSNDNGKEGVPSNDESAGTLTAAVSAVGPDGATYTFPAGAFLSFSWTTDAGASGSNTLSFNGTAPTQSFSVAAGTYTATLSGATALSRISNGVTTTVAATVTDPQPYAFTVTPGQTTALTFHLTIQGIGDLTFSTGTLTTGLQVDAGTTAAGHAQASGTAAFGSSLNGPTSLNTALTIPASVSVSYVIAVKLTSPFAPSLESICANVTATSVTSPAVDAGVQQNVEALFAEATGGTGQLCIYDASSQSWAGQVLLTFSRSGAATTAPMIAALGAGPGPSGQAFTVAVAATAPSSLYNGTTAKLSQLSQPVSMPVTLVQALYLPNSTYVYAQAGAGPTVTIQLLP